MGIQLILQFTNAYKCAHGIKYSIRGNILKVFGHSFGLLCWYSCNQSGFFWSLFFSSCKMNFARSVYSFVWTNCRLGLSVAGRLDVHSLCVWLWYFSVLTVNLYFWEKELMPLRYGTPFSFILSPPHSTRSLARSLARSIFFILCLSNWSIFLSALRLSNCRYTFKRTHIHQQPASQAGSQTKWKEQRIKCLTNTKSYSAHSTWISKQRNIDTAQCSAQLNTHAQAQAHSVLIQLFQYVQFHNMCKHHNKLRVRFHSSFNLLFRFCAFLWNKFKSQSDLLKSISNEIFFWFSVEAGSSGA